MAEVTDVSLPSRAAPGSTQTATATVDSRVSRGIEVCDIVVEHAQAGELGRRERVGLDFGTQQVSVDFTFPGGVQGGESVSICARATNCQELNVQELARDVDELDLPFGLTADDLGQAVVTGVVTGLTVPLLTNLGEETAETVEATV